MARRSLWMQSAPQPHSVPSTSRWTVGGRRHDDGVCCLVSLSTASSRLLLETFDPCRVTRSSTANGSTLPTMSNSCDSIEASRQAVAQRKITAARPRQAEHQVEDRRLQNDSTTSRHSHSHEPRIDRGWAAAPLFRRLNVIALGWSHHRSGLGTRLALTVDACS